MFACEGRELMDVPPRPAAGDPNDEAPNRPAPRPLEHFQEKWNPVFRPKMRQMQKC
jgi:hypothetical protein